MAIEDFGLELPDQSSTITGELNMMYERRSRIVKDCFLPRDSMLHEFTAFRGDGVV
jgi:hypothetical protein